MKKHMAKVITILVSFTLTLQLFSSDIFALGDIYDHDSELERIESATEAYLKTCAEAIYSYNHKDISSFTIKGEKSDRFNIIETGIATLFTTDYYVDFELKAAISSDKNIQKSLLHNLNFQESRTSYFSKLHEIQEITYSYFNSSYCFNKIISNDTYAIVNVTESLNYQYSFCDEPTVEVINYNISLAKVNNIWKIAEVISDDQFFQTYHNTGFDLNAAIRGVLEAFQLCNNSGLTATTTDNTQHKATTYYTIPYNKQNAVNYAMTFSTQGDDGNSTPSFKNNNFYWFSSNCMNFASQCVWAGFGGSNSSNDIQNKQGMDTAGNYTWWCTASGGTNSWASCSNFKSYVTNQSASTDLGLSTYNVDVPYNSNDMLVSSSSLVGSVVQVKGQSNGSVVALGHAVFINAASGSNRNQVYYTAYSNCVKNKLLSTYYPASTTNTYSNMYVIVPLNLRTSANTVRLWADLPNAIPENSSLQLTGYSNTQFSLLTMEIFRPNASAAINTYQWVNASSASVNYSWFNLSGQWTVKLTGVDSAGISKCFYYTVRVY